MSDLNFFKQFVDPSRSQIISSSPEDSSTPSMPSRKRSRGLHDIDGEIEVESASSSFRPTYQKRSRVALAAERGGSVVSDDEDDNDGVVDGYANGDADDDKTLELSDHESEESAIDELAAARFVQKGMREHKDNLASEQGIIEEVFCRNFMCHSKLRIKLGPLINFIIGHNGSGKSAVLTALTMCLGGKATATNRGASLKSLIKEGEESSTLAVKIKNQGDGAYKPELYGRSITVERHFSRAGTSGFKLKSAEERIISTKKADLDDILDFYAFQLDNPINVLTQDMARQFLSNSTPSDKYKFFIRGTQLEVLDNDYKIMEEHVDNMQVKLQSRAEDVQKLAVKADEAEKKKARLDKTERLQDQIRQIEYQHAWAQVEEQEKILEKYQRQVEAAERKVQDKTEEAEGISGTYDGHNQASEAANRHFEQLQEQQRPLEEQFSLAKEQFDSNRDALKETQSEERMIREDLKKAKNNAQKLQSEVAKEHARLAGAEGTAHQQRLERLEELRAAAQNAECEQMEHGTGFAVLERQRTEAFQAHEAAKPALVDQRDKLGHAQMRLNRLQGDRPRPFDAYRGNMENLVRAIDRETRWRSKPVGPMGLHVRLLKPEWSSAIEKTFGGTLESFIVATTEDQKMLTQLMRRVDCVKNIYIGDPTPLDTTGKEPDDGIDTILRVLEIDSPLVRNQLIINQMIDQTALIPDRNQAEHLMFESGSRPRNIRVAMSFIGGGKAVRFEYSRSGAAKSGPVDRWEGMTRMKTNHEEQIRMQREVVDQAKRDVDGTQQHVRQLDIALKEANQAINRFNREQSNLRTRLHQAQDQVQDLENEIESNRPKDGALQELERQLAEATDDMDLTAQSFQDSVNARDRLGDLGRELKSRLDAAQGELETFKAQVGRAAQRKEELAAERRRALHDKNAALQAIEDAKKDVTQLEEKRDRQQRSVNDDFIAVASRICERVNVDPGMSADMLDKRLAKLHEDMRNAERQAGGTREELTIAYEQAKTAFKTAEHQMKEMQIAHKTLTDALTHRHHRWQMFRKYIAMRLRINFSYLLSERQFRGRVLMEHKERLLDIKVEPNFTNASDAGREAKTLSGGEKSFSTICLLLSIWEAMGSPIRCLDEFDVFMDSVNRTTSMTMMIQTARRSVGRQFILITPQSMNNVEMGDDVRVHKMSDPERGQTALSF